LLSAGSNVFQIYYKPHVTTSQLVFDLMKSARADAVINVVDDINAGVMCLPATMGSKAFSVTCVEHTSTPVT